MSLSTQQAQIQGRPPIKGCMLPSCSNSESTSSNLQRCSTCKAVAYCSSEHQLADWSTHKPVCDQMKKLLVKMQKEERDLRNSTDFCGGSNADIFERPESVGHFWGLLETRGYTRARNMVFFHLKDINHLLALRLAAAHGWDMLRLCTSDNLGVRDVLPAILIRIRDEQKAYDFCRFWMEYYHHASEFEEENGEDVEAYFKLRYLGNDLLEDLKGEWVNTRFFKSSQMVPITLLKVRAYRDLEVLMLRFGEDATREDMFSLDSAVLEELKQENNGNGISECILRRPNNPNANTAPDTRTGRTLKALRTALSSQITQLVKRIDKANKHFFPGMFNPEAYLRARPESYSAGSVQEAQLLVQYNWSSWAQFGGVLEEAKRRLES